MRQQYGLLEYAPKPFVKWAGGKRQLMPQLQKHIPKKFEKYFEPFVGGGALFFYLVYTNPKLECNISDLNADLILAYVTIRDKVNELIKSLENHSSKYFKNKSSYYYSVRDSKPRTQVGKVSRLLFLNRTCFNGLYRVNSKGRFNVPLGRYANPNIVNKENLLAVSDALKSDTISVKCRDFSTVLEEAERGDFVYFDPPYQPISKTANFTSYTHSNFSYHDLKRLAKISKQLASKGVFVLLSNSNSDEVSNLFSTPWKTVEIEVNRAINSDSKKRTGHTELLLKNY